MPPVKTNWMPYMQALRADGISKSKFGELQRKEKDKEGFSSRISLLHETKVPLCWPLPVLDLAYNSSLNSSYDTFLGLNSRSTSWYLPYFSHDILDIVVHEGLIANQTICNPHYFASLCFDQFEAHAFLPMPKKHRDPTQRPKSREESKKSRTEY